MADAVNAELEKIRQGTAAAAEALGELDRRARAMSREHPFLALAGAVLLGFVVGRAASRR